MDPVEPRKPTPKEIDLESERVAERYATARFQTLAICATVCVVTYLICGTVAKVYAKSDIYDVLRDLVSPTGVVALGLGTWLVYLRNNGRRRRDQIEEEQRLLNEDRTP